VSRADAPNADTPLRPLRRPTRRTSQRRFPLAPATLKIRHVPQISYRAEIRFAYALVAVALAYFAVMACRKIELPGLYYDEVEYVNPAIGGPVARSIMGIPVLVVPYVGALKAYLYFPIFALFGVSAATIRLPAILISLLTLVLTFKLARVTFRPSYSALLVLLMAVDPIFIFLSKADYGPIVLMMFFKMLALYFFFLFIRTPSPRYLWGLTVACALGIFDKFNFIWFVLGLSVAAVVVFRSELRAVAAQYRAKFIWPAAALLLVLAGGIFAALPSFLHAQPNDLGHWRHISYISRVYLATMNSRDEWFLAPTFSAATITNWVTIPVIGLVIMAGATRVIRPRRSFMQALNDRVVFFYLLIFVVIFMELLVTLAAENPNHVFVLYPFHYAILIAVANRLSEMPRVDSRSSGDVSDSCEGDSRRDRWARAAARMGGGDRVKLGGLPFSRSAVVLALVSAVALAVGSEISVGVRYKKAVDQQAFNHLWTPAIYELATYANHSKADAIVSVTWGIHRQVFALSRPESRRRYADLWQEFTELDKPQQGRFLAQRFFIGKRVLVLAYVAPDKGAAIARQHFLAFAKYYFGGSKLKRLITNNRGEAMFGVYYLDGSGLLARRSL